MQLFLRNALILIFSLIWVEFAIAAKIQWIGSLSEGSAAAKAAQKPIMVESYKDT